MYVTVYFPAVHAFVYYLPFKGPWLLCKVAGGMLCLTLYHDISSRLRWRFSAYSYSNGGESCSQLLAICTHTAVPGPTEHNMCYPDNLEEMDTSLESRGRSHFFVSEKLKVTK